MALQEDLRNLDVHELENLIEKLDQRAKQLGSIRASIQKPCNYLVLYRIAESDRRPVMPGMLGMRGMPGMPVSPPVSLYFDPPQLTSGEFGSGVLRSQLPVTNFDLYLEKNKEIAFVVYRTYTLPQKASDSHEKRNRCSTSQDMSDAIVDESIEPVDEALMSAVVALLEAQDEYTSILDNFLETPELQAPYLFVFHQRNEWDRVRQLLPESSHQQMAMLWNYIVQSHGAEYTAADASMSNGLITTGLLKYLFKPGQLLLQSQDDEIQGWICADWPKAARRAEKASQRQDNLIGAIKLEKLELAESSPKWELSAWHWDFDGNFHRRKATLPVSIKSDTNEESEIPINTLSIFPLKYASEDSFKRIQMRGRNFWKCRKRGLVSYREDADTNDSNLAEERYMIDLKTYQILHKADVSQRSNRQGIRGYTLPRKAMDNKDPPDENFEFLLPAKIKGFNLRTKKWLNLVADKISDVKWNKEAFSKVVIERKAKDLIRALVSNQLESEKNTDLIEGKGNGLILLLHGGPGTGKTLTAESVAEIAEKPLYRVTCGDVGTKAEDVEKYLESVLYLGKLWGCVVLLDEADIFLQQRNLEDLQRNALVSVFLRVLEYYEGILVLTSNRVGTFDEAFKSRIQLALHYPALGPYQRLRIWENFFDRLDKMEGELIDLADLRDHLSDLKEEEMNGRQIRNAITTARQYAKWQNDTLTYKHLKDVIEISGRFDKYLTKLHGGLTEGQLAEDEGLRLGGED
ncbi:hypothetical protein Daus18300_004374 [Diaporthe australafricana]|uniref:AAA+ ATPase domain-containing protein n=1 Tax=Diaporthe australafricana TaxID=127596 RepID=A0ABR3X9W7_9PEZI